MSIFFAGENQFSIASARAKHLQHNQPLPVNAKDVCDSRVASRSASSRARPNKKISSLLFFGRVTK
jgi:hypothetical protein